MSEFETYFVREYQVDDTFKRDLSSLLRLSTEARGEVAKAAIRGLLSRTEKERNALRDELGSKLEEEPAVLSGPLEFLSFFAKIFLRDPEKEPSAKDEPVKIAADLARMDNVYPKDLPGAEESLAQALILVRNAALSAKDAVLKQDYAVGVLPTLKGIGTTVEMRAVQGARFKFGDDFEQYTPTFVGLVGVASIRINLQGSERDFFVFQASESGLANLIDKLRAAQKELRFLQMSVQPYEKSQS